MKIYDVQEAIADLSDRPVAIEIEGTLYNAAGLAGFINPDMDDQVLNAVQFAAKPKTVVDLRRDFLRPDVNVGGNLQVYVLTDPTTMGAYFEVKEVRAMTAEEETTYGQPVAVIVAGDVICC